MATIAQIARATGLSYTSVAGILSHREGFSAKTRERVLAAAEKMGYQPNYLSKALAGGKSHTIGLVFVGPPIPVVASHMVGVEEAARRAGYVAYMTVLPHDEFDHFERSRRMIDELLQRRVDGILIEHHGGFRKVLDKALAKRPVPTLWMGGDVPLNTAHHLKVDYEPGYEAAAKHVAELGHRDVMMITTASDRHNPMLKVELARRACDRAGVTLHTHEHWMEDPSIPKLRAGYEATHRLLNDCPDVTCILTGNDFGAMAAIKACRQRGLRVPEDISIIGFDDVPAAEFCDPALTTIRQPREEVGVSAFEMLHQMIRSVADAVTVGTIPCGLSIRESTARARGRK